MSNWWQGNVVKIIDYFASLQLNWLPGHNIVRQEFVKRLRPIYLYQWVALATFWGKHSDKLKVHQDLQAFDRIIMDWHLKQKSFRGSMYFVIYFTDYLTVKQNWTVREQYWIVQPMVTEITMTNITISTGL